VAVLIVYGINTGYKSSTRQGLIFLLFATFMALGAVYSWAYLPDVQRSVVVDEDGADSSSPSRRLETKNLEELGEGYERARLEGQLITIREKWTHGRRTLRRRLSSVVTNQSGSGVTRGSE